MTKLLTLVVIEQNGKVLLGMKKRGFGAGRWNGFGGKVMDGEDVEVAARRELREEALIDVGALKEVGRIDFEFAAKPGEMLEVHIFQGGEFSGEPTETEEMKPAWFDADKIPFDQMWPDDRHWFPLFLAGKKFKGKFLFGKHDAILRQELSETAEL